MTPFELRSLCRSTTIPLAFATAFDDLSEADRKQLSMTAQEIFAEARADERGRAGLPTYAGGLARLALLACCGGSQARRVKSDGFHRLILDDRAQYWHESLGTWADALKNISDALERILVVRRPAWAGDWITQQLEEPEGRWHFASPVTWTLVRRLMRAGVMERPAVEGYTRLMASQGANDFDLASDADLLESDIWQLFAAQNTGFSWVPDKHGTPTVPAQPLGRWPRVLLDLANNGQIDRGRVIDETLAALWRGFRPEMTMGFVRYLDHLELAADEMADRESAFRDLLRHDHGPVVGEAIEVLKQLHDAGRLDVAEFLKAVPTALALLDKGRVKSTLSFVDRLAKQAPAERPLAALAVVPALNHESSELQDRAVKLVAKWKAADPTLDLTAVLASATSLLGHNHHQLQELAGATSSDDLTDAKAKADSDLELRRQTALSRLAALPDWIRDAACLNGLEHSLEDWVLPPAFNPDPAACPVLASLDPIEPIQTVDELIDAVAHLFQVIERPEEVERVIDAILRLGGQTTSDFVPKTAGLCQTVFGTRRFGITTPAILFWSAPNVVRLIGRWLATDFADVKPHSTREPGFEAFDQRVAMLITRFRSKRFGPVLATPTHSGGWIDPRVFIERIKSLETSPWLVHRFDFIAGLLRLAPDFRSEALASASELPSPFGPVVRYALGGDDRPTEADREQADEWLAAGRARRPRSTLEDLRPLGLDEQEPDGITRAVYRFRPAIDLQVYSADMRSRAYRPPCVRVVPDVVASSSREIRPTVGLAASLLAENDLRVWQPWQARMLATFWPLNTDAVLAIACCRLVSLINLTGSYFEQGEAWMSSLHAVDRGWSEMARTALLLGAASRNDRLRGTAVDALIEGIADGRARPGTLAETLLHVVSGGWIKLTRLADSLREVARTSILAERIVAEVLDRLIASWQEIPRDGHAILALEVGLLSNLRQAPSPEARSVLAGIKGTGKAGKLAKQLSSLETDDQSPAMRHAAVEAAEGRIARAVRVMEWMKAEGLKAER